jgi:hypothetical protein
MKVEFWTTSFAAPKLSNMNLLVELVDNFLPIPLLVGKMFHYVLSFLLAVRALFHPPRATRTPSCRPPPCPLPLPTNPTAPSLLAIGRHKETVLGFLRSGSSTPPFSPSPSHRSRGRTSPSLCQPSASL